MKSDTATEDPVKQDHARADKVQFDRLLNVKKHLCSSIIPRPAASESTATKLPKLELPTLNGDILQWKNFWELFCISVRDRPSIPKEKLMYLQNAIKDKSANNSLIAGLTKSCDHYDEPSMSATKGKTLHVKSIVHMYVTLLKYLH